MKAKFDLQINDSSCWCEYNTNNVTNFLVALFFFWQLYIYGGVSRPILNYVNGIFLENYDTNHSFSKTKITLFKRKIV